MSNRSRCPDDLNGTHQLTDRQGKCVLCRHKVEPAMSFGPDASKRKQAARAQDPLSIDGPDEGDYLDGYAL